MDTLKFLKKTRSDIDAVLQEVLEIINDMAATATKAYRARQIYPFRELCLGYLLICRNNLEATLLLCQNNLIHQVSYINRNMFEMTLTLYYIDNDEMSREARLERYFDYNNAVIRHRAAQSSQKYPDFLEPVSKKDYDEIVRHYRAFAEKYKSDNGRRCNEQTWSGLNMSAMIESLTAGDIKEQLIRHYEIIIKMMNNFLHPTRLSLQMAIEDFLKGEPEHMVALFQVMTTATLTFLIADKFLSQYQKGRPKFRERIDRAKNNLNNIQGTFGEYYSRHVSK